MIFIILDWIFWFIFCFNLGFFVLRKTLKKDHNKIETLYNFWFGLFCLIVILQFISLVYPINNTVVICLSVFNTVLLIFNLKSVKIDLKKYLINTLKRIDIKKVILFTFVAMVIALIANLPVNWYDSLLYHLNSVKWLTDYGTIRGLANIHFPLGYNNATFILAAIMGSGFYTNSSSHVMNSFLLVVFSFQVILFLFKKQMNILAYIFGLFSLLILSTFAYQINSLSTDLSLAVFFLLFNFYVIIFEKEDVILSLPILILAAASKFSAFAVLAMFSIFVLVQLKRGILLKKNIYVLIASFLFFTGFIYRNIILSGWAFYPLKLFGFNVPWQVPSEQIKVINDGLTAWSRLPGPNYMSSLNVGFLGWFIPWFNNNKGNPLMLYSMLLVPMLLIYVFLRPKIKNKLDLEGGITKVDFLIVVNLITLAYSFITAPDFRYMALYILIPMSLILSGLLVNLFKFKGTNFVLVPIFVFLILSNLYKVIELSGKKIMIQKDESAMVKRVTMYYSDQSFDVLVPVGDDRCGNSELPCVPHAYGFKMFEHGNIKAGFYSPQGFSK